MRTFMFHVLATGKTFNTLNGIPPIILSRSYPPYYKSPYPPQRPPTPPSPRPEPDPKKRFELFYNVLPLYEEN